MSDPGTYEPNRLQRFLTAIMPASWAMSMEEESRDWMLQCGACGYATSLWEQGGIRWKATGNTWMWWRCPECGTRRLVRLQRM